ncbi:hypothetical protein FOVSG1_011902 [Fusarium oxysporum f. sp. vasinfectum]
MASAQEAEQIIQSLNGHGTILGKHIKLSAKKLLYELLRYTNGKTFAKATATNESPFISFKIYPNRIVTDCNNDYLNKADVEAICQPDNGEQVKGANFKTIVAATKKAHIQSGNFSFEFQHNIFDANGDMMRPIWVTPVETIPDNFTRIKLYLHDQGSKEDIQNLGKVIISQFVSLQEECLLFLKDIQSMSVEIFDKDGKMHQSKYFRKHTIDGYRISLKVSTVDEGKENTYTQIYHVTEQSADDLSTNLMLAFPLTDGFKVQADDKAKKLFNLTPLQTSPLGFHIHSDFGFDDDQHSTITTSACNLSIQAQVATAFFRAILQFCEHPTLRYYWPLFLTPRVRDLGPFWSDLDAEIRSWIAQNPVLISRSIDVLSEEYKYVFKHRPDRFLGFVQHLWAFDGPRLLKNPTLVSEIQGLPAQNLCAVDRSLNLQNTWVPLKELKERVQHYMEYPDEFPFLKLEEEKDMNVAIATKWSFLTKHFSVKWKNDMDFLLEILDSIKHSRNTLSPWQTAKVIELYTAIRARLRWSIGDERERAQEFFDDSGILYIDETGPTWTGLSSCLWTAPADMVSAYSLRGFYEERAHDKQQMDSLHDIFHVEMGIRDATVEDLVTELLLLRNEGCEDIARITDIYKYLDKEMTALSEMRKLQEWLMENPHRSPNGAPFEVVNALTSIFASDVSVLDSILEDQGIVQVPFENQGAVRRKTKIRVRLPEGKKSMMCLDSIKSIQLQ